MIPRKYFTGYSRVYPQIGQIIADFSPCGEADNWGQKNSPKCFPLGTVF